jgi:hypothetical protein
MIRNMFNSISPRSSHVAFVGNRVLVEETNIEGFSNIVDIDNVYNVKADNSNHSIPEGVHVQAANNARYSEIKK